MPRKRDVALLSALGLAISAAIAVPMLGTASAEETAAQPVWADDFDGPAGSRPDATKWAYDLGYGEIWGNNESQTYTDSTENVSLDGAGNLVITARKDNRGRYTSGRLKTEGKFSQLHGRIEARIKVPRGPGLLPAFWMMGEQGDWPDNGEVDIMENVGQEPNTVYSTVHGPGYAEEDTTGRGGFKTIDAELSADFHVFALNWSPGRLDFQLDGETFKTVTPENIPAGAEWAFDSQPFYMLLNVAIGGDWPGEPRDDVLPQKMLVDYVHVYAP